MLFKQDISEPTAGFLQDENSWIFMSLEVAFYTSKNGKQFKFAGKVVNDISPKTQGTIIEDFGVKTSRKARYVKVVAKNRGGSVGFLWMRWWCGRGFGFV